MYSQIVKLNYLLFFSASFRTYLEDARDQIAPISTRGDQLKQVKARELSETDFREAGQGLQERMTGVLQKIGWREEPSGTLRTCMRCIAQKAIRAGKVLAHPFYILCTKLNFSREPENSKRGRHLLQETDISTSRPTFTGSKSSLHTPDPGDSERKRAGSPSPGTSKQRREVTSAASSTSGGDARGSGGDETRR